MLQYTKREAVVVEAAAILERRTNLRGIRLEGDVDFINPPQVWQEQFTPVGHAGEPVDLGFYLRHADGHASWMTSEEFEAAYRLSPGQDEIDVPTPGEPVKGADPTALDPPGGVDPEEVELPTHVDVSGDPNTGDPEPGVF